MARSANDAGSIIARSRPILVEIGGKVTTEFMALADAGEAELVYCPNCDYAANTEVAECITQPQEYEVAAMEKDLHAWRYHHCGAG